jgi:hypothetical protein
MFSDRHRLVTFLVCLAAIVALGAMYSAAVMSREGGLRSCRQDPVACDGEEVIFPTHTVTAISDPHHYEIGGVMRGIAVEGLAEGLSVGDRISVRGRFRAADGAVIEEDHHIHRLWVWKERLGLLGLLAALLAAPLAFSIREGRVVERG